MIMKAVIGLIGLGVMGENLALNIAEKGFQISVYNRTREKTEKLKEKINNEENIKSKLIINYDLDEFIDSLIKPRKIILMLTAGTPIDKTIEKLIPKLDKDDIIIDGGNSFFEDTERRNNSLSKIGLKYLGVGVSGGEEGARHGPCIMVGGSKEAYITGNDISIEDIFNKIAAKTNRDRNVTCCSYLGERGSGHFVKMVHNGIEYGIMQILAESYDFICNRMGISSRECSEIFEEWNNNELNSYLLEISYQVLKKTDLETRKSLVEMILDKAGHKGTGKWTSQTALNLGVPIPTIDAAVSARMLSYFKDDRVKLSELYSDNISKSKKYQDKKSTFPDLSFGSDNNTYTKFNKERILDLIKNGIYCSIIISYTQGISLIQASNTEYNYNVSLKEVARIWKGGCIIRAKLLENIEEAYKNQANSTSLLYNSEIKQILQDKYEDWVDLVKIYRSNNIPCPAISSALDYFESWKSSILPANFIQALRDYFGSHGYKRIDKDGDFHTSWT